MKLIYSIILTGLLSTNIVFADEQSDQTLAVAQSFLEAAGSGNGEKLLELMNEIVIQQTSSKKYPFPHCLLQ